MSNCSDSSSEDKESGDDSSVFQVGFNISVSGSPGNGFQVVVNDKEQVSGQLIPSHNAQLQLMPPSDNSKEKQQSPKIRQHGESSKSRSEHRIAEVRDESKGSGRSTGAISKQSKTGNGDKRRPIERMNSARTPRRYEMDRSSDKKDVSIVEEIKNAMGNFDRFSERLKEVPRFHHRPVASSTPFMDRYESRSESNLSSFEDRSRRATPRYEVRSHFRSSNRPGQCDLFLKPLPAEDYCRRGFITRYFDGMDNFRHYGSMDSLARPSDSSRHPVVYKSRSDSERYDGQSSGSEYYSTEPQPVGILKKTDNESGDKQSTSSTESLKDIKIYQSGGILIMQNFNENLDLIEKKDISDISAKLIENCNRLKDELNSSILSSDDYQKPLISNSSEEVRNSGKVVQFDLPESDNTRSRSGDSRVDFSDVRSDSDRRGRDSLLTSQNQDFPSLSTQENESIASNTLGMSPTSSTSGKKLEWDSGADVGYLNLDLDKENLSTIERIILRGLSNDGRSEKKVVYEKRPDESCPSRSKFVLERLPSELVIEAELKSQEPPRTISKQETAPKVAGVLETKKTIVQQKIKTENNKAETHGPTETKKTEEQRTSEIKRYEAQKPRGNEEKKITEHCSRHKGDGDGPLTKTEDAKPLKQASDEYAKKSQGTSKKTQTKNIPEPPKLDKQTHIDWSKKKTGVEKSVQTRREETKLEKEIPVFVDKSTNVDTLFKNFDKVSIGRKKSDDSGNSESSDRRKDVIPSSPRVKKLKKKKVTSQTTQLTARLKDKIDNIIDIARQSNRTEESSYRPSSDDVDMGIPKKIYRKYEDRYTSNEVELCRDFEEIVIDQRFKIKQNVPATREGSKSTPSSHVSEEISNGASKPEKKGKNRPVSASSSSNITVLPNENNEIPQKAKGAPVEQEPSKFTDQLVQTTGCKFESKGIQAFESRKSSLTVDQSDAVEKPVAKKETEIVKQETETRMTCSKNIQASGFTSSLPKHLAHPKETHVIQNQNTKSTQFFGGPINSLPNYHSNLTAKTEETCSRMPKVLKTKSNTVSENNRINKKDRKNSIVTEVLIIEEKKDNSNKSGCDKNENCEEEECKGAHKKKNSKERNKTDFENKENLSKEGSIKQESRRKNSGNITTSLTSKKTAEEKESASTESKSKKSTEKKLESPESTDGTGQDFSVKDLSNKKLTTQMLKKHGDSVDRSFIQEKYFRSQLVELEQREMVSRSTSMEKHHEHEQNTQTTMSVQKNVTVGCQYSVQRRKKSSSKDRKQEKSVGVKCRSNDNNYEQKWQKEISTDQCDSSQNLMEDEKFGTLESTNQEQGFGTVDSMPSSTQTAHSWVPGMQDAVQNINNVVGRARSFEYLPGHIYESSGNLREELPSETDQNLISGSTSGSSESDSKPSTSEGVKDSEGRQTVVLENTARSTYESSPRTLDENLVLLEDVISKLHDKETLLKLMTQSLLTNVIKYDGSGDGHAYLGAMEVSRVNSRETRQKTTETATRTSDGSDKSSSDAKQKKTRKTREKEMSIAVQTDWMTPVSDSDKFYHERKELARRIDEEKEHQIKWIENEIQHLNLLRGLLEKHDELKLVGQRRKKQPLEPTEEATEPTPIAEVPAKTVLAEVYQQPPQSAQVSGVTLSTEKNAETLQSSQSENTSHKKSPGESKTDDYHVLVEKQNGKEERLLNEGSKYGLAVSLVGKNNVPRQVAMVPVGVQVTLKDKKARSEGSKEDSLIHGSRCNQRHICPCDASTPMSVDALYSGASKSAYANHCEVVFHCRCKHTKVSQFDMNTQYPSLSARALQTSQTTATQVTDSLRNCLKCGRSNCVCIDLKKAKSRDTELPSSKNKKIKVIDDNEFGKSIDVDMSATELTINIENRTGTFSEYNSTERHSAESPKSSHKKEKVIHVASGSSSSPEKACNCSESSFLCTCEKCSCACHNKPLPRCKQCKLLHVCKECKCYQNIKSCTCKKAPKPCVNCKSNVCKKCDSEKLAENVCKICRCEADKEQNCIFCSCHLPKSIHVPKCNCHEKYSSQFLIQRLCKCHNRNSKYFGRCKCNELELKKSRERIPSTPEPNVACPCCEYYYKKVRANLYERQFGERSLTPKEKKRSPAPVPEPKKNSPTIHGHPRHYFLKIEETEEDSKDSTEVEDSERKKPVEVVTIKIPVKKRWKNKNHKKSYENEDPQQYRYKETKGGYDDRGIRDEYRPRNQRNEYRAQACTCCACKRPPTQGYQEADNQRQVHRSDSDYLNYDKKEYMTKSELERQKRDQKDGDDMPSLQECLVNKRPDFYNNAEYRRHIISEMAREREQNQSHRVKNLANILSSQNGRDRYQDVEPGSKRIFTTAQLKEQTLKHYKRLPEVLNLKADRKKKEEYRTNRLMADIFAKKVQLNTLKGQVNMSNSVSVLSTI